MSYRVWPRRRPRRAEAWYADRGCCGRAPCRRSATLGIGEAVRVLDPLGFTLEFFARERCARSGCNQRYELHRGAEIARIDHFNICVNDAKAAYDVLRVARLPLLGDDRGQTSGCTPPGCTASRASTTSPSPAAPARACTTPASSSRSSTTISRLCDLFGAIERAAPHRTRPRSPRRVERVLRVPARPRRHRIEIYTSDYFTGDPDEETAALERQRHASQGLLGRRRGAHLVHRGDRRARPRRQRVPVRAIDMSTSEAAVGADGLR